MSCKQREQQEHYASVVTSKDPISMGRREIAVSVLDTVLPPCPRKGKKGSCLKYSVKDMALSTYLKVCQKCPTSDVR